MAYIYVKMDKQDFEAGKCLNKNFRWLTTALFWMQKEYGKWASYWQEDTYSTQQRDVRNLLSIVDVTLNHSLVQGGHMPLNESCPDYQYCDAYCFAIGQKDGEPENGFSFSEQDEKALFEFTPDVGQSIKDILWAFGHLPKTSPDIGSQAIEAIYDYYGDEDIVPNDVRELKAKEPLSIEDYIVLGDECQACGEKQLAAYLYGVASCKNNANKNSVGKALIRLATLYMESSSHGILREQDAMKAVDLLSEALSLGCNEDAKKALEEILNISFAEHEDAPNIDYIAGRYTPDRMCLAAFCLYTGIGWNKDVEAARALFTTALKMKYFRASYYLKMIL